MSAKKGLMSWTAYSSTNVNCRLSNIKKMKLYGGVWLRSATVLETASVRNEAGPLAHRTFCAISFNWQCRNKMTARNLALYISTVTTTTNNNTIERSPFFVRHGGHCCRWDLVGRTIFWIVFLSGLQKLEQRAKKCIELRGEYVE